MRALWHGLAKRHYPPWVRFASRKNGRRQRKNPCKVRVKSALYRKSRFAKVQIVWREDGFGCRHFNGGFPRTREAGVSKVRPHTRMMRPMDRTVAPYLTCTVSHCVAITCYTQLAKLRFDPSNSGGKSPPQVRQAARGFLAALGKPQYMGGTPYSARQAVQFRVLYYDSHRHAPNRSAARRANVRPTQTSPPHSRRG